MSPRNKRTVIRGLAVVATVTLVLKVVPAIVRRLDRERDSARQRRALAADARQLALLEPTLEDSFRSALTALVGSAPLLIEGRTESEAGAALEGLVRIRAERSGLGVLRVVLVPDSAAGPFRPVRVRAELEGDVRGLARFLRAVEGGSPLLTLPSLAVTSADPSDRVGAAEKLHAEVQVRALFVARGES